MREEQGAGLVEQALGRPHLPADAAAHRVVALAQPEPEQAHEHDRDARRGSAAPSTVTTGHRGVCRRERRLPVGSPRLGPPGEEDAGNRGATKGRIDSTSPVAADARTQTGARGGRVWGHARVARCARRARAGEPATTRPGRTERSTVEPASTTTSRPMCTSGPMVLRAPTTELAADVDRPEVHDVSVDPVAGEVDLGLDGQLPAMQEAVPSEAYGCRPGAE